MLASVQGAWDRLATIPHLEALLLAAYVLYLLWIASWIVLQKREPVATLSWVLSLAALPYLGLLIYYWLGPQKVKRQRLRRGRSRSGMESYSSVCPPDADCTELAKIAQSTTGLAPSSATEVHWLVDGAATYAAIIEAIRGARDHIHLQYYIFQPDHSGTAICDALMERARAGVKVRLLMDAVGSSAMTRRSLRTLRAAGVETAWFHPSQLLKPFKRPWLNLRTHRKVVVVDGRIGFTGGINVTDEENEQVRSDAYRDLHMRLQGHVVRSLQLVFLEDWLYATGQGRAAFHGQQLWPEDVPSRAQGDVDAQVLVSGPDSSWESIHRLMVAAIHEARHRVWLVTPYFVPGEAARMALTSAALGAWTCACWCHASATRVWSPTRRVRISTSLLEAGVRIYEYGPRMLHTKALLADDDVCIVGSANFDSRSFRLNFELSMLFRDQAVTAELAGLIDADLQQAQEVRFVRHRPLWRSRLPEACARLLSPLL